MGSEPETVREANREKTTYDKTLKSIKIGVCEMQGWRPTMEDAAIVLPNYEPNTSLFGVLDGHGGSIISEFVSVNFKNILVKTKSYKKGNYEKALVETFLTMDELLKNRQVNNFIYETHYQKERENALYKKEHKIKKESYIKLRFETGEFEFDLDEIDLSNETDNIETIIFDFKNNINNNDNNKNINTNNDSNIINDDANKTRQDTESAKEEEKSTKNLQIDDIFFTKSSKLNSLNNGLPSFEDVYNIKKCLLKFKKKQLMTNEKINNNSSKNLKIEPYISYDMGTTANIMLIKNNVIYIANVGDSLSVMYKNKKAYNLNREHQTIIETEKDRVLKSGAKIEGYRINGMLNLTRAIGDLRFKSNKKLTRCEQSVIALPDITRIDNIDDIDFIIMGCDGIWDCVKRQVVCDFIEKEINENPEADLSEILKKIFDKCISPVWGVILGTDNMSCIVIQFLHDNNKSKKIEEKIKINKVDIKLKGNDDIANLETTIN